MVNRNYGLLILGLLLFGCKEETAEKNSIAREAEFNQELSNELSTMAEIDQTVASNAFPPKEYSQLTQEKWEIFKDSVYRTNQERIKEIFDEYGFVGYDLAGKDASGNFWLIVQHSDHNPDFQQEVLQKMKIEVEKGNADASSYGLLVDRVNLNTGQKQIYGTQVAYKFETGQAYAKKLADSANVNQRRKSIGLEPIEIYLNGMSEMHFEMNKSGYIKNGITKPKLYPTD